MSIGMELKWSVRWRVTAGMVKQYLKVTRVEKSLILDQLRDVNGWHRDHARKALCRAMAAGDAALAPREPVGSSEEGVRPGTSPERERPGNLGQQVAANHWSEPSPRRPPTTAPTNAPNINPNGPRARAASPHSSLPGPLPR
ncbi:MAG: hypothetical protein ACRDTZ_24825 [Pseudonocardiaceae bacterium]